MFDLLSFPGFSFLHPLSCHFGVISTPAAGRTVFGTPIVRNKKFPAVLALPYGLALPRGGKGIGEIDARRQIVHLGGQPGCFFVPIAHQPVRPADSELPIVYTLDELEIEVQQNQRQRTGGDGPRGPAGPFYRPAAE